MKREHIICWVGAKALIENEEKILIIKESFTKDWELPGGKIEKSETNLTREECLMREIKEELGSNFEVKIENIFDTMFRIFTPSRDPNVDTVFLVVFLCKYISGEVIKQEEELTEYVWVSKENYKNYKYVNGYGAVIEKYFSDK